MAQAGCYPQRSPSSRVAELGSEPRSATQVSLPPTLGHSSVTSLLMALSCTAEWTPLPEEASPELGQPRLTPTFHLNEVQLVDGLQQWPTVQGQFKLCRHLRLQGTFDPLLLRHLDTLDQGVRDLKGSKEFRVSTCKGKIA